MTVNFLTHSPFLTVSVSAHPEDDVKNVILKFIKFSNLKRKTRLYTKNPSFRSLIPKPLRLKKLTPGKVFLHFDFGNRDSPCPPRQSAFDLKLLYIGTKVSPKRAQPIHSFFDAVFVPSVEMKRMLLQQGVDKPIFVLPLYREFNAPQHHQLCEYVKNRIVFANLNPCESIDNQLSILRAFTRAFKNSEQAFLWIYSPFSDPIEEFTILSFIEMIDLKNIRYERRPIEEKEYANFLQRIDCYIDLSFRVSAIKYFEMMSQNKPIIMIEHPTREEFCNNIVHQIPSPKFVGVDNYMATAPAVNEQLIVTQLRKIALDYPTAKQSVSHYQRIAKVFAEELQNQYDSLLNPKQIVLGTENVLTDKGIETTSLEFYERCQKILSN
jgi:hypothetical protein